jgi:hypothetical protein
LLFNIVVLWHESKGIWREGTKIASKRGGENADFAGWPDGGRADLTDWFGRENASLAG